MGTDLHAPLGRNRKTGRRRPGVLRLGRIAASLCLFAIGGFSLYTAFRGDELERTKPPAAEQAATAPANTPQPPTATADQAADGMPRADSRSGANVEQMVTGDGSVVTKYSPRPRDGGG
ncbi:divergent polysaccharide deacetylase family protein, partial [Rhizobium ruizarguesonis]